MTGGAITVVGGGLAGYFGIVGVTEILRGGLGEYGLGWTLTVIPGYTVWGVGLLVAATSYAIMTKPPCLAAVTTDPASGSASARPRPAA